MSLLKSIVYNTGLYKMAQPIFGGIGHIITLHRVVETLDDDRIFWSRNLEVTVDFLEETILDFKREEYDIISLEEMYRRLKVGANDKKFVVFTFDDGYEDNYTLAYPIFKRHKVPFTIYITKALIEKNLKCWWYDIEDILLCYKKIQAIDISLDTVTKEQKEAAYLKLRARIIHTPFENGYAFYRALMAKYPPCKPHAHWKPMSIEQLKMLSADPLVTIGAHTANHYPLSKLQLAEATLEVVEGKEYLESLLKKPIVHFSYPYGSANEAGLREMEIVLSSGFVTAATTRIANIFPEHKDFFGALPRIPLIETKREKRLFKMSLSGFLQAFLYKRKRVVTL